MKKKGKVETLAEYLTRGGTIKRLEPGSEDSQREVVKQVTGGPIKILTMDEAELYLGEIKPRKAAKPKTSTLDLSALPEALRKKFIDRYGEGEVDGEQEE